MVISVGYDPCNGKMDVYNTETKILQELYVSKIYPDDAENIQNFFQNLCLQIACQIDCFCMALDSNYNNEFRKRFVEIAAIYDVTNIRIIGFQHLQLIGAIRYLSKLPKIGDLLWIMNFRQDCLLFSAWNFDEMTKGWKFEDTKLLKNIDHLRELDAKILTKFTKPSIFIYYQNSQINEDAISTLFQNSRDIKFQQSVENSYWALLYARYCLQENGFEKYKSELIFERTIKISIDDDVLFHALPLLRLPFSKNLTINVKENEELKAIEKNECTYSKIFNEEKYYEFFFTVDVNGTYSIHLNSINSGIGPGGLPNPRTLNYQLPRKYSIPIKNLNFDPLLDAIGIDYGNYECCAAVIRKNGPDFVVLDPVTALRTLPSYIAFDERNPKCGKVVVDRMRNYANFTVYDSKRILGRNYDQIVVDSLWPFNVKKAILGVEIEVDTFEGKKFKAPEEIAAALLKFIKNQVESYQGRKLSEAVITIPSGSTDDQIAATAIAAELAGWEMIHFIPEPVAAAFAYFTEKEFFNNCKILICDCGGGTVDICVAKVIDGKFEVLNYDGDSYLGGRDFDKLLYNHFESILKNQYLIDVSKSNKKYSLNQKCQNFKHALSTVDEVSLSVDSFECDNPDFITITRQKFEELSVPLLLKIKNVILRSIEKSGIEKSDINYVFQVGGGCRMPMIKAMLKEVFPSSKHECSLYPDWVVAHGAALYAYHLKTNKPKPMDEKQTWLKERIKEFKTFVTSPFLPSPTKETSKSDKIKVFEK